jgi:5'-methylthioadenosine phosphorylase
VTEPKLAFIGGSGLYDMKGLTDREELDVETPFGAPSDSIVTGTVNGTRVAFLPRHGRGHRISPTEIPVRANLYALKSLGVERIISVSAVGSLREELKPLDLVVPDQLIDRTRSRVNTFFDDGIVAHVGFADPFCPVLSDVLAQSAERQGVATHRGGTYVVMEGPQFSTRAESELYRSWGAGVIGMTGLPEAKLAREAEICYATMALVTDYDCWHETEDSVSVELIVENLTKNAEAAQRVIADLVSRVPATRECGCASALRDAIITRPELVPGETLERLSPLIEKYLSAKEVS